MTLERLKSGLKYLHFRLRENSKLSLVELKSQSDQLCVCSYRSIFWFIFHQFSCFILSTNLFLRGYQVDKNRRVSCCIQKITEMVFAIVFFFSALLGGVVGGILTILTLKILEAGPREQTRVEVDNGRETGEGRIGIGIQESTKLEQEHDERCC